MSRVAESRLAIFVSCRAFLAEFCDSRSVRVAYAGVLVHHEPRNVDVVGQPAVPAREFRIRYLLPLPNARLAAFVRNAVRVAQLCDPLRVRRIVGINDLAGNRRRHVTPFSAMLHHGNGRHLRSFGWAEGREPGVRRLGTTLGRPGLAGH